MDKCNHQTAKADVSRLSITKMPWLYIGRLEANTTEDDMTKFLLIWEIFQVKCKTFAMKGTNKTFKAGFPFRKLGM